MKKAIVFSALSLVPFLALAQQPRNLTELINFFTNLIYNSLVPLFVALATIWFFWGMVTFIKKADEPAEREKGRSRMIWGVIALFVILAVWGLVAVLGNTFGIRVGLPGPPGSSGSSTFTTPGEDCIRLYGADRCRELNALPF